MKNFFGIIGGMGTEATESFIKSINRLVNAKKDQDFPNYLVFNHAKIPDRTNYILNNRKPNPFPYLIEDIYQLNALSANFVVITCNTAHYFLPGLQKIAHMPILNMPKLAVTKCKDFHQPRIGILATSGTLMAKIYQNAIKNVGIPVLPDELHQRTIMKFIYDDIKHKNKVSKDKYHEIINYMLNNMNCDYIILGCTELSVAQERQPYNSSKIIDAQAVLAEAAIDYSQLLDKSFKL